MPKRPHFFSSLQLQRLVKNFLEVAWACSRYLRGAPNSKLSNAPTFMVTRPHKHFLLEQTRHMSDFFANHLEMPDLKGLINAKEDSFFVEFSTSKACKKFLEDVWAFSRFLRGAPNSDLSNALTFIVTRPHKHFLMKQTWLMDDFLEFTLKFQVAKVSCDLEKVLNFLNIFFGSL